MRRGKSRASESSPAAREASDPTHTRQLNAQINFRLNSML